MQNTYRHAHHYSRHTLKMLPRARQWELSTTSTLLLLSQRALLPWDTWLPLLAAAAAH